MHCPFLQASANNCSGYNRNLFVFWSRPRFFSTEIVSVVSDCHGVAMVTGEAFPSVSPGISFISQWGVGPTSVWNGISTSPAIVGVRYQLSGTTTQEVSGAPALLGSAVEPETSLQLSEQ